MNNLLDLFGDDGRRVSASGELGVKMVGGCSAARGEAQGEKEEDENDECADADADYNP